MCSVLTWKMCSVKKGVKGAIIRVIRYTTENRACRDTPPGPALPVTG